MALVQRTGRGRVYALKPATGSGGRQIDGLVSAMDELSQRIFDQFRELDAEVLGQTMPVLGFSLAHLIVHMWAGEYRWITGIDSRYTDAELEADIEYGNVLDPPKLSPEICSASHLQDLGRLVRAKVTKPTLAGLESFDTPLGRETGPNTATEVLMHLIWHLAYHSGQVGAMAHLQGYDYTWTFAENSQ